MWTRTIASQLLRLLAAERRRVISDWRVLIFCRRIAAEAGGALPEEGKAKAVVKHLLASGDIGHVRGARGVYVVETPYAAVLPVAAEEVVQEANPWAVFSHFTALSRHGLTDEVPTQLWATHYGRSSVRVPLGTRTEEWAGLALPTPRLPREVVEAAIQWSHAGSEFDFGVVVDFSHGLPIYITDRERTLLDAVRDPGKCGGIGTVIRAWREGAIGMDVERLVRYVDRFKSPLMRQRVGFLLSRLGVQHVQVQEWKSNLRRGGSMVLVPGVPFSSKFDPEWNLSLNIPDGLIAELSGDA